MSDPVPKDILVVGYASEEAKIARRIKARPLLVEAHGICIGASDRQDQIIDEDKKALVTWSAW